MVNGLFKEISEEEMMSVNGGCGGGSPSPGNSKATPPSKPTAGDVIRGWLNDTAWRNYPGEGYYI